MNDAKRLLDEGANEFEKGLLRAHVDDGGSDELLRKTLLAMGIGVAAGTAAASAAAGSAVGTAASASAAKAALGASEAAAKVAAFGFWKWIGIGAFGGVVAFAVVQTTGVTKTATESKTAREEQATHAATVQSETKAAGIAPARSQAPPEAQPQAEEPAKPPGATVAPTHTPAPASAPLTEGVAAGPAVSTQPMPEPSVPPKPAPAASSLVQEVAALDRVRNALGSRNGAEALRQLDAYHREFPRGALGPEATVLRIEALVVSGDRGSARILAERFLKSPTSASYATRVRSLVGPMSNP